MQTLSWGEYHANDRNPIYLKIDGKSFQAQAIFAKTALRLQRRGVEKSRCTLQKPVSTLRRQLSLGLWGRRPRPALRRPSRELSFQHLPLNTVPEPREPSTLPSPRPGGLLLPSPISLATLSHPAQTSELTNLMVATGTPARPQGGRHARPAPLPLGTSCHCRVSQSLEYIEPMRSGQWMSQLLAAED